MRTDHTHNLHTHTAELQPPRLESESLASLVRGLAHDLTTLFGKELALAKAEVREAAGDVKASIAAVAVGGALAFAGLVITLLAAVYALTQVLDPWLAALLVGLVSLAVGYGLIKSAQAKMKDGITPERTLHSIQKDKATVENAAR